MSTAEMPPDDRLGEHPADTADRLQEQSPADAAAVLRALSPDDASAVLAEMDSDSAAALTRHLAPEEAAAILGEMPHDEAADIAAEMSPEHRQAVLAGLPPEDSASVHRLLHYPEDTAGGIMSDRFIALPLGLTIGECHARLRTWEAEDDQAPAYPYVVDAAGRLVGLIKIRDLVFRQPDRRVDDFINRDFQAVQAADDRETVAKLFAQYHYMALPVLESDGRLVGVVGAEQAISAIQAEATEDMQLMVGLSGDEHIYTPWRRAVWMRLPWLLVNVGTAMLAASVVGLFESTIAQWTVLAVFLPIVAGQSGNAGMQTLTVVIRAMALGEISRANAWRTLRKEATMGLVNGLICGLVVGAIGLFWKGEPLLGLIVGLAMVFNMLAAALAGLMIPLALRALRVDPALASSIFLTTITDSLGFFIFLGLATLLLFLR